jgi:hypothetical protein
MTDGVAAAIGLLNSGAELSSLAQLKAAPDPIAPLWPTILAQAQTQNIRSLGAIRAATPPDHWLINRNLANARETAMVCRTLGLEIAGMQVQLFGIEADVDRLQLERTLLVNVTRENLLAEAQLLDETLLPFAEMTRLLKETVSSLQSDLDNFDIKTAERVSPTRVLASWENNNGENPGRTAAGQKLMELSRAAERIQLQVQMDGCISAQNKLKIEAKSAKFRQDAANLTLRGVDSTIIYLEEREQATVALIRKDGIALIERLSAAIARLAAEESTLRIFLEKSVEGLHQIYGELLDADLYVQWRDVLASYDSLFGRIDAIVSLLSTTSYLVDQFQSRARSSMVATAVEMVGSPADGWHGTCDIDEAQHGRLKGISIAIVGANSGDFVSDIKVSPPEATSSRSLQVGNVVGIAQKPDPLVFGGNQLLNRPSTGKWMFAIDHSVPCILPDQFSLLFIRHLETF